MKETLISALFVGALVLPGVVHGATAAELRAEIAQILDEIYQLQTQLNGSEQPHATPATPATEAPSASAWQQCPRLSTALVRGQSGDDVTQLQQFLAQNPAIYPEGDVTGYFGPATERALQRFQARQGIVASGDPQSTGYGRLGPSTRAAIAAACGADAVTENTSAPTSTTEGILTVSTTDNAREARAVFEYRGNSCTSFVLDWGDGSDRVTHTADSDTCSRDTVHREITHTYARAGAYTVMLRLGTGALDTLPVVARARIQVTGETPTGQTTMNVVVEDEETPADVTVTLRTPSGSSCTSYSVDWGDGTEPLVREAVQQTNCSRDIFTKAITHTYDDPGAYMITARAGAAPLAKLPPLTQRIRIGSVEEGAATPAPTTTSPTPTPQDDNLSAHIVSTQARTIEFSAHINASESCSGGVYTIIFGDGTNSLQPYPADVCQSFTRTLKHTYAQDGTYTARLFRDGVEVDTVTFSVGDTSTLSRGLANAWFAARTFISALFE